MQVKNYLLDRNFALDFDRTPSVMLEAKTA